MKPWIWASAIAVFSLGVFGAYWLERNPGIIRIAAEAVAPATAGSTQAAAAAPAGTPAADRGQSREDALARALENELAAEFRRVADVYEQSSRFPPYSIPIAEADLVQYQYNRYVPVNVELKQPGGSGDAEIRVVLEKLHFEKGEPITGLAAVYGADAEAVSLSEVELLDRANETLASGTLNAAGQGEYPIRLSVGESQAKDWPSDLLVRVKGQWNGRSVAAVAPVFLDDPIGGIDAVGRAHIEGAHLMIPVELEVEGPGFYVISANLYSADGEPLVHVEHQAELSRFDDKTELKIHRSALEAAGDAGPYELRNFMLRQLPSKPGQRTRFGPADDRTVEIPRFSFDQYSGAAYQDPLRQARLDFLRGVGSQD